ncbi:hypothetical protein LZ32DRAFT_597615 [Colletotrichum eremochloae]|nr:hypothetical protein LZ32DRAFT_597615 [Colletotrichum eremochloae]
MRTNFADPLFGALNKRLVSSQGPGLAASGAADRERDTEKEPVRAGSKQSLIHPGDNGHESQKSQRRTSTPAATTTTKPKTTTLRQRRLCQHG